VTQRIDALIKELEAIKKQIVSMEANAGRLDRVLSLLND